MTFVHNVLIKFSIVGTNFVSDITRLSLPGPCLEDTLDFSDFPAFWEMLCPEQTEEFPGCESVRQMLLGSRVAMMPARPNRSPLVHAEYTSENPVEPKVASKLQEVGK